MTYIIEDLAAAAYTAGISAVYPYGESNILTVDFDMPVSVEDINNKISIYPNPASNFIHFTNVENNTIEFYNEIGVLVKSTVSDNSNFVVSIDDLKSGIYIVKIISDDEVRTFNISKIK